MLGMYTIPHHNKNFTASRSTKLLRQKFHFAREIQMNFLNFVFGREKAFRMRHQMRPVQEASYRLMGIKFSSC